MPSKAQTLRENSLTFWSYQAGLAWAASKARGVVAFAVREAGEDTIRRYMYVPASKACLHIMDIDQAKGGYNFTQPMRLDALDVLGQSPGLYRHEGKFGIRYQKEMAELC